MSEARSEMWMVRTATNLIVGPFERDELIEQIQSGRFSLHDEVCPSGGYWFFLDERAEVESQLGLEVTDLIPRGVIEDDVTMVGVEVAPKAPSLEDAETYIDDRQIEAYASQDAVPWFRRQTFLWKSLVWLLTFFGFLIFFSVLRRLRA